MKKVLCRWTIRCYLIEYVRCKFTSDGNTHAQTHTHKWKEWGRIVNRWGEKWSPVTCEYPTANESQTGTLEIGENCSVKLCHGDHILSAVCLFIMTLLHVRVSVCGVNGMEMQNLNKTTKPDSQISDRLVTHGDFFGAHLSPVCIILVLFEVIQRTDRLYPARLTLGQERALVLMMLSIKTSWDQRGPICFIIQSSYWLPSISNRCSLRQEYGVVWMDKRVTGKFKRQSTGARNVFRLNELTENQFWVR